MSELKGKNVFISGVSRGIGKSIAIEFAKEGCNIYGVARTKSDLDKLKLFLNESGVQSEFFAVDIGDFF